MSEKELFDHRPQVKKRLNLLPPNPEKDAKGRFPSWLHRKLPKGGKLWTTEKVMREERLHTVCEEAKCPNLMECWSHKTATFLAMGKECTRACGFCDIDHSKNPAALEADEPKRIADSVKKLGLKHAVITMVARDDLVDGGAEQLAKIVQAVRDECSDVTLELLTSDLDGNEAAWKVVMDSQPEIFNHNLETVRELTPRVRHKATYDRTLKLLEYAKNHGGSKFVKSGIMVGLGETEEQVFETIRDLRDTGCQIITMGQYLQPNQRKLLVKEFVTPEQFKKYEQYGKEIGVPHMYCGPFVRSSYNAGLVFEQAKKI